MESCRKAVRERVLQDMLGSIERDPTGGGWKVLVLDSFTTKVLSSTLKMSDILDCNVSMVEDLQKKREPSPLVGVYFIQPTLASVCQIVDDFSSGIQMYPSVHIFFSSKVSNEVLVKVKSCAPLLQVLKTLKESNLEFLTVDSRTMVTDHPAAAVRLLGDQVEVASRAADSELESISTRLATLVATLKEFPAIRFQAGRTPGPGEPPGAVLRSVLAEKLAHKLLDRLEPLQRAGQLPAGETCDLLILDRSYDPVAPVIHEWTYEALVHDLLPMEGNSYSYQVETVTGRKESKEVSLDEGDSLWCELRHLFIAEVYSSLGARFKEFQTKNKAAKLGGGSGLKEKAGEMSSSNIRALITALPQFREVLSKLSLHIQVSSDLKAVTHDRQLTDLGELEQDLVLGEKNSKDMLAYLTGRSGGQGAEHGGQLDSVDKMRLLLCYCATHPDKMDATKRAAWQRAARLSESDMLTVCNLAFLGVSVMKPVTPKGEKAGFFSSKKKGAEKKDMLRRKREEDTYALYRFEPLLRDILVDLAGGRLPVEEFPYVRPPTSGSGSDGGAHSQSARTARGGLTWAKRNTGNGSAASARRLVVFVIGGAVRSEMRIVHELSRSLNRDIVLGSTSIETPHSFVHMLQRLNTRGIDYSAQ